MALTTRTIPSLMNGISQQPAILRSSDQTEDELNTWTHIAEGLSRRPPTQNLAKLTTLTPGTTYSVHHINRDVNERYLVIIKSGAIIVHDEATGVQKTVNAPLGYGYLSDVGDVYRAMSIKDYTFIINTKKVVALKAVAADQVAQNVNNRWLGGTAPTNFQSQVAGFLNPGGVLQYNPNPTTSGVIAGTVASMDKLPTPIPAAGTMYRVLGASTTSFVSFYVISDGTVWNETVAPGLKNALDETTMPWALVREADGTFTFAPFSWQSRRVGDDKTNPAPPFVNRTLRDVFFYQNRLGLASDDSVTMSCAGDHGDFWRRTILDYIDSDAIAASAATTDVALIDYVLPFADGIMLFSRQRQLALTNSDQGVSASSLAIRPVTNYLMAPGVRPTPMGSQAHFLSEARGFVAMQEYTRLAGSDPTEAADITAHVPHLLPQGASQIIPLPDLDAILVLMRGSATPSKAFVYQFFWDGQKKLISAWRPWDFGTGVPVSGVYESGNLFLTVDRPDGVWLEKMDLSPEAVSPNQDHRIYLDRQVSPVGMYDAVANKTTFDLGYPADLTKLSIVQAKLGATPAENLVNPAGWTVAGNIVSVVGDYHGPATAGYGYTTKVVISRQFAQDWQNRPLVSGRLQMHKFTVNLTNSVYLRAEVFPYGIGAQALEAGLKAVTEYSPRVIWAPLSIIGGRAYETTAFSFSVAGNSKDARIELINDTPFESTITSAEWSGLYFNAAQG